MAEENGNARIARWVALESNPEVSYCFEFYKCVCDGSSVELLFLVVIIEF